MQREMPGTSSSSSSTNNVVAAPIPRVSQTNGRANRERATDRGVDILEKLFNI